MSRTPWHEIAPVDPLIRPERDESGEFSEFDHAWHRVKGRFGNLFRFNKGQRRRLVKTIRGLEQTLAGLSQHELKTKILDVRKGLLEHGFHDDLVAQSFAAICEVSARVKGMRHFDCQLIGGLTMLNGMVAEMQTGEGKTLTATLTAATAAFAGWPVHVISVNDYLTRRDAEEMGPLYQSLGLTVGCVVHGQTPVERQQQYRANITYCTNKEVTFDYLRDKLVLMEHSTPLRRLAEDFQVPGCRRDKLFLPGLHFAIVDEADSILVDEARTPLIISGADGNSQEKMFYEQALSLAVQLEESVHFTLRKETSEVSLTKTGQQFLTMKAADLEPIWSGTIRRESTVCQALVALHCFHLDDHYVVQDGKVQIVDEFTGRIMTDRSWEKGLHQLIEVKEGCEITGERESLARISYQKFFRRYRRLSGMTGTAHEVRHELWDVYNLPVMKIPTNRPLQRRPLPSRVLPNLDEKLQEVVTQVAKISKTGRPVLIGTRSVASSEALSAKLLEAGIRHDVLNAKRDAEEAEIVARAGEPSRVTIATNMAGRGTDIKLDPEVRRLGGLHVILTERHEAKRIDRQLFGRCGRQGDPGSYEAIVSLRDPMLVSRHASQLLRFVRALPLRVNIFWRPLALLGIYRTQRNVDHYYAKVRFRLLKQDRHRTALLSFSGRPD